MNAQVAELTIAYVATAAAMLAGLLAMRADARAYWRLPVFAAMAMTLGVIAWNLARKHGLPLTRGAGSFYVALALYAVLGLAIGIGYGRLTRRPPPDEAG
jgi:hypothetical protein